MDKKSRYFLIFFFFFLIVIVFISFVRYIFFKDYLIKLNVSCDPTAERCFVAVCDPAVDSTCEELIEQERQSYYKILVRKAPDVRDCQANDEDCLWRGCDQGQYCEEIFCINTQQVDDLQCSTGQ